MKKFCVLFLCAVSMMHAMEKETSQSQRHKEDSQERTLPFDSFSQAANAISASPHITKEDLLHILISLEKKIDLLVQQSPQQEVPQHIIQQEVLKMKKKYLKYKNILQSFVEQADVETDAEKVKSFTLKHLKSVLKKAQKFNKSERKTPMSREAQKYQQKYLQYKNILIALSQSIKEDSDAEEVKITILHLKDNLSQSHNADDMQVV